MPLHLNDHRYRVCFKKRPYFSIFDVRFSSKWKRTKFSGKIYYPNFYRWWKFYICTFMENDSVPFSLSYVNFSLFTDFFNQFCRMGQKTELHPILSSRDISSVLKHQNNIILLFPQLNFCYINLWSLLVYFKVDHSWRQLRQIKNSLIVNGQEKNRANHLFHCKFLFDF